MALLPMISVGKQLLNLPVRFSLYSRHGILTAPFISKRNFSLSSHNNAKKIIIEETDNQTTIRGEFVESPFESRLVKAESEYEHACPICALNLNVKHTDVLILSQFLREDGCMLPRRTTGLCGKQQRRVTKLVAMAQKAGLMPNLAPHWSKKDPQKRFGSKKYNRYFDEATLEPDYRQKSYSK